jgi:hypothetical protein
MHETPQKRCGTGRSRGVAAIVLRAVREDVHPLLKGVVCLKAVFGQQFQLSLAFVVFLADSVDLQVCFNAALPLEVCNLMASTCSAGVVSAVHWAVSFLEFVF